MPDEPINSSTETSVTEDTGSALVMQGEPTENERTLPAFPDGSLLAGLPMQLDVTVPIPDFRVQNLLALEKGMVLETRWHHADDVPVWCGGVQLVWSEFEVLDQKLAVRVTRVG
jgi:flagellar motor switch/type III secretory pathway protein FliN